jgi:hypothetical protein
MRTAREVLTPWLCRNAMISRITLWSAQLAVIRSARLRPIPSTSNSRCGSRSIKKNGTYTRETRRFGQDCSARGRCINCLSGVVWASSGHWQEKRLTLLGVFSTSPDRIAGVNHALPSYRRLRCGPSIIRTRAIARFFSGRPSCLAARSTSQLGLRPFAVIVDGQIRLRAASNRLFAVLPLPSVG